MFFTLKTSAVERGKTKRGHKMDHKLLKDMPTWGRPGLSKIRKKCHRFWWSHRKVYNVILLWWGYSFWFLLIFWFCNLSTCSWHKTIYASFFSFYSSDKMKIYILNKAELLNIHFSMTYSIEQEHIYFIEICCRMYKPCYFAKPLE